MQHDARLLGILMPNTRLPSPAGDVGDAAALVLECANVPHSAAVARATGRPVFDVVTTLEWFWSGPARADG